ncbi:MAG: division/cell wall cluster transcriptional repressor MraZ [Desulfobacterales bacterium]|nr:division/cell wall cluster transcriptional repressor MraZ [Desulfobacterales bacterium]
MVKCFQGRTVHTLDPKGRFIIPSRFKDVINEGGGDGIIITNFDNCLYAYTYKEWETVIEKMKSIAKKGEKFRRFRRFFIGGAFDCQCDKQGRILIPQPLREYANLEKDIILVGVTEHFEIWSKESWIKENEKMQNEMNDEDIREDISELGL